MLQGSKDRNARAREAAPDNGQLTRCDDAANQGAGSAEAAARQMGAAAGGDLPGGSACEAGESTGRKASPVPAAAGAGGDARALGDAGGRVDAGPGGAHPAAPQKAEKLWTPLFIFIVVMTLCSFVVGQGLNSGTSVYLDHMGQGAALAGALAAVFSAAAAVARLACGPIIDNVGRVVVMLGGTLLLFVGTILPALVPDVAVLSVCRVLQGIGFSAATTASATAASDVLPLSRLGEGIGYYGLGQALAMSVGPALALFLVNTSPAENLFWGMSAMAALAFAFTLLCRYEKNPARLPETAAYRQRLVREAAEKGRAGALTGSSGTSVEPSAAAPLASSPAGKAVSDSAGEAASSIEASLASGSANDAASDPAVNAASGPSAKAASSPAAGASSARSGSDPAPKGRQAGGFFRSVFEPRALPGMLPMLVLSPAFGFGIFFMGLYGTSLGYASAGLFYTVSAVAMIAVRLTSKAFMDRVAPFKIMCGAVACGLLGFVLAYFGGTHELLFYAAGIPYGVCLGVALPLNQSVAVKNTPGERWGAANALYLLASDIGIGVASAVWGVVNDMAGFSTTILCVMCCIVVSLVVAWFAYPGHGMKPLTQAE